MHSFSLGLISTCGIIVLGQMAFAGGSVVCSGVSASHQFFGSASWNEFYGNRGADDEVVISNHSSEPIFFQYWTDGPTTSWITLPPKESKSLTVASGTTIVRTKCNFHEGSVSSSDSSSPSPRMQPLPSQPVFLPPTTSVDTTSNVDVSFTPIDPDYISVSKQSLGALDSGATHGAGRVPAATVLPAKPDVGLLPDPYADPATIVLPVQPTPDPSADSGVIPAVVDPDGLGGVLVDVDPASSEAVSIESNLAQQILNLAN